MKRNDTLRTITVEWRSLLRDIARNSWAIILSVCLTWTGTAIYAHSMHIPQYTSSMVLAVDTGTGSAGTYANLTVAAEMATVFADVFEQPAMQSLAAENIGFSSFPGKLSADVHDGTNIMTVSVTASSPEQAHDLLTSALAVYPRMAKNVFSNAVFDVLSAPQMPTGPDEFLSTARRVQLLTLAALLSIGVIVLLSLLHDTVKTARAFTEKIDTELLGTIVHEKSLRLPAGKQPIRIDDANVSLRYAEHYQQLAGKFETLQEQNGSKVFLIVSAVEGEGRTTAALSLSLALTSRGHRVIRKHVPAAPGSPLISGIAQDNIAELKAQADFILIDTPPLSRASDALHWAEIADACLLVVRTDTAAVCAINDAIHQITDTGGNLMGGILNDVPPPLPCSGLLGMDPYAAYRDGKPAPYANGKYSSLNCKTGGSRHD